VDVKNCLEITKADGVMIGRGALGNPWVFGGNDNVGLQEKCSVILRHAQLHIEHYGKNSMVTFRKHLLFYFKGDKNIQTKKPLKQVRADLVKIKSVEELKKILKSLS